MTRLVISCNGCNRILQTIEGDYTHLFITLGNPEWPGIMRHYQDCRYADLRIECIIEKETAK